jgi:hypothetical protein
MNSEHVTDVPSSSESYFCFFNAFAVSSAK